MVFVLILATSVHAQAGNDGHWNSGDGPPQRIYKLMAVGDSITVGGAGVGAESYRYPLWEKLYAAGYLIEYVGTQTNESRIGILHHEGYSGKNAEFLAATVEEHFKQHPADIVLLHAGHNYSSDDHPVEKILAATEHLIESFRASNPKVIILLAQVIPSGKLPKYSYLPALNDALGRLAPRLNTPDQPVILVDQATGFDWASDTIADKVHPNAQGAMKMADRWFAALTNVMEAPAKGYAPKIVTYKKNDHRDLTLHIFPPSNHGDARPRPAIVFFFGGGWRYGTPLQFYPECAHFADQGLVAISADYRIAAIDHTTPFESVADGKSAIRWVRQHAAELGVDPHRIIAAGASAGGQVAAATGIISGLDAPSEDLNISSKPDAMLLWYATVDNGPDGFGCDLMGGLYQQISPLHNIDSHTPPSLFILGTHDPLVPVKTAREFKTKIEQAGGRCDLKLFPGAGHPLYEYQKGNSLYRQETLMAADDFLASIGFISNSNDATYNRGDTRVMP